MGLNEELPGAPSPGIQADVVIDARSLRCPLPLLRLRQALREAKINQLLELQATDAGSVRDVAAYARLSGNTLEAFAEYAGVYHYWMRRVN